MKREEEMTPSRKPEDRLEYVISGQLKCMQKVDFGKVKLSVLAFVEGKEIANAAADKEGKYELKFEYQDRPPSTELRVVPTDVAIRRSEFMALSKMLHPGRYVLKKHSSPIYHAEMEMAVPYDFYLRVAYFTSKTYHIHGVVYAQYQYHFEAVPGVRLDFYEVDQSGSSYIGCAYSGPDGGYSFEFKFSSAFSWEWLWPHLRRDIEPDIKVCISQYFDGTWTEIYESDVNWDIVEDFHCDYLIPAENVRSIPDPGESPETGFRFSSIGLLPIDSTRISEGYATSQSGDPISLFRQPFCGTLRIFGLFGQQENIVTYKAQVAQADQNGPTGSWQDITDALHNRKWNTTEKKWEYVILGPDPSTNHYQNIDTEPEWDWHEHALKVTWFSGNVPNGYYALRIVGYKSDGTEVIESMPVIRVDNTLPMAVLDVDEAYSVGACGQLSLPTNRMIRFRVTAYDPEGHVLKYQLSGTRGRDAFFAGNSIVSDRQDFPSDFWTGVKDAFVEFQVSGLTGALSICDSLAYNFELHVWGTATNGYASAPQKAEKQEVNLVVAEP